MTMEPSGPSLTNNVAHNQQPQPVPVSTAASPQPSAGTVASQNSFLRIRSPNDKQTFTLFVRVLLKYLQKKNPKEFRLAKAVVKVCMERNRRKEPGYESLSRNVCTRLQRVVSPAHWERAQHYLHQLLLRQQQAKTTSTLSPPLSQQSSWDTHYGTSYSPSWVPQHPHNRPLQTIDEMC